MITCLSYNASKQGGKAWQGEECPWIARQRELVVGTNGKTAEKAKDNRPLNDIEDNCLCWELDVGAGGGASCTVDTKAISRNAATISVPHGRAVFRTLCKSPCRYR